MGEKVRYYKGNQWSTDIDSALVHDIKETVHKSMESKANKCVEGLLKQINEEIYKDLLRYEYSFDGVVDRFFSSLKEKDVEIKEASDLIHIIHKASNARDNIMFLLDQLDTILSSVTIQGNGDEVRRLYEITLGIRNSTMNIETNYLEEQC